MEKDKDVFSQQALGRSIRHVEWYPTETNILDLARIELDDGSIIVLSPENGAIHAEILTLDSAH